MQRRIEKNTNVYNRQYDTCWKNLPPLKKNPLDCDIGDLHVSNQMLPVYTV